MSDGRKIAENALWLFSATTAQKIIAFLAFTLAARLVGPFVTGEYFYAVAVTSTFVIIGDLGMTPVIIRAIASGAEEGRRLLGAALRFKLILIPVAILASLAFVAWSRASAAIAMTTGIACLVMAADSIHLVLYGALRGQQKLHYEATGMFVGQILTGIAAVSAAYLGFGAPGLATALLMGSVWNVAWATIQSNLRTATALPPTRADMRMLIHQAIPFALAGIFVKVYSYLDSLVLKAFHGEVAVGTYAVAYKVTYAFQFIPLVFIAALFPAMSAVYAAGDRERLKSVYAGSLRLMAMVGAPVAAGLSAIAPRFIPTVYGLDFLGSVAPMAILPWVLLPIFIDFPIGSLLNASHRAHWKTAAMGGCMVVNAALNALLVPLYGPVGAAWASVGSFSLLMVFGILFTWRDLPSPMWLFSLLLRAGCVATTIWFAVRIPGAQIPFVLTLLFGGAVGVSMLLLFRLLTIDDLRVMHSWFRRRVVPNDPTDVEQHQG
jgi:O-antigen/teichoic acid export membrane protein